MPQFSVLWAEILKAKGEPSPLLAGWAGRRLVIDHSSAQDCFFDLVHFTKQQWNEQYNNINGEKYSKEEEATASDVAEFPLARQREYTQSREGFRRDFDPVARPEKGKGKGKAWQRPVFERAIECWTCGQYGHRSFECPNGWERRYDTWRSYERRPGGQASWRNTGGGYQNYGGYRCEDRWGEDWGHGGTSSSSSSRRPPEPARRLGQHRERRSLQQNPQLTDTAEVSQPGGSAYGDIPMNPLEVELERRRQGGQRRRQIREEYSKVIFSDGSFEYYAW